MFNAAFEMEWRFSNLDRVYPSDLFHPVCLLLAAISSLVLLFLDKYNWSVHTSPPQFFFYLTLAVGTAPTFKVQVEELQAQESPDFGLILRSATLFPVAALLFFLNCFSDFDTRPGPADSPEKTSSVSSTLVFGWLDSFIVKGFRTLMGFSDLPSPPPSLEVELCSEDFLQRWNEHVKRKGVSFVHREGEAQRSFASIWPVLFGKYWLWYASTSVIVLLAYSLGYVGPQMLGLLINHVDGEEEAWKGYFYIGVIFASQMMKTFLLHRSMHEINKISLQMRANVLSLIYQKSLKLSNNSRKRFTVGEVTNYMAVDAQRILTTFPYSHNIWSAPFQVSSLDIIR